MSASQHGPGRDVGQGHQSRDSLYRTAVPGTKALIVEDDQNSCFALGVLLEGAGFTVVAATNGAAAIQTLTHRPGINLVLMDIMMPLMDGYETMAAIRKIPECKDLPIIAVTAKTTDGERARCIAAGTSDYIPKPINAAELFEAIQPWLPAWPKGFIDPLSDPYLLARDRSPGRHPDATRLDARHRIRPGARGDRDRPRHDVNPLPIALPLRVGPRDVEKLFGVGPRAFAELA